MPVNRLPLTHDTVEALFTLVCVYIDDYLKAAACISLPVLRCESHQKGSYSEIMTIGRVGDLPGEASQQKWLAQVRLTYRARSLQMGINLGTSMLIRLYVFLTCASSPVLPYLGFLIWATTRST